MAKVNRKLVRNVSIHEATTTHYIFFFYIATVPQRGTEVRQLALPIQQASSITKKDSATVTSPVEIKPVRIGDPKIRSKITFEVVTARVIESAGKKHVVSVI